MMLTKSQRDLILPLHPPHHALTSEAPSGAPGTVVHGRCRFLWREVGAANEFRCWRAEGHAGPHVSYYGLGAIFLPEGETLDV